MFGQELLPIYSAQSAVPRETRSTGNGTGNSRLIGGSQNGTMVDLVKNAGSSADGRICRLLSLPVAFLRAHAGVKRSLGTGAWAIYSQTSRHKSEDHACRIGSRRYRAPATGPIPDGCISRGGSGMPCGAARSFRRISRTDPRTGITTSKSTMVLRVGRCALNHEQDSEDAFQATILS